MKRTIIRAALAFALAGTLILPTACAEPQPGGTTSPPASAPASESNRWLELLGVLPVDDDGSRETTFSAAFLQDYAYLKEKKRQYPQISSEYEDGMFRNLPTLFGESLKGYNDDEWKRTLGFVRDDVEQSVFAYSALPVDYYEAARGNIARDSVDHAVKTGPMNEILEVVPYAGQEFYSWDTDRDMNLSRRSGVRHLGRGMRLAMVDDFVLWTGTTQDMKDMIDSREDNIQSLADLETYQLLAQGLTQLDVFTAFFSSESQAQGRFKDRFKQIIDEPGEGDGAITRRTFAEELQRQVYLKPYDAFAAGAGLDGKGYYLAIVLLNPDEQSAKENVAALERQMKESRLHDGQAWMNIVESMETTSQGRLTLSRLYGRPSVFWNDFDVPTGLFMPLFIYEG